MAPLGTVFKNGIIFLILTAGITFAATKLILFSLAQLLTAYGNSYVDNEENLAAYNTAFINLWLGLLIIIGGTGLVYMKSLSDTVEEGMIEF